MAENSPTRTTIKTNNKCIKLRQFIGFASKYKTLEALRQACAKMRLVLNTYM